MQDDGLYKSLYPGRNPAKGESIKLSAEKGHEWKQIFASTIASKNLSKIVETILDQILDEDVSSSDKAFAWVTVCFFSVNKCSVAQIHYLS
jgi:hypothetical protein